MQEKFRLRCDINDIQLADADAVSDALGKYSYVVPYHRYHYLFTAYHELTHGGIDDETFFTYGDISSERPVFAHMPKVGLESVFAIEESSAADTLYIVEQSAWSYYSGKLKTENGKLQKMLEEKNSKLIVI